MSSRKPTSADLAKDVCAALVVEGLDHGWAIGSVMAPGGELGRIWSLSRPLAYRALDQLVEDGRLRRRGTAPGAGRARVLLAPTARGRRVDAAWLDEPVAHLRDVRTELLIKLELRRRRGLPSGPFLRHQVHRLAPVIDAVSRGGDDDLVGRWRFEQAQAVRRFLAAAESDISASRSRSSAPGE